MKRLLPEGGVVLILKNKLFPIIGLAILLSGFSPDFQGQIQNIEKKIRHLAQIKLYNGTPTLFLEGKPVFYGVWWCSAPEVDGWKDAGLGPDYAEETGIHIYAFDVGSEE